MDWVKIMKVETSINRNTKTGKFECTLYIIGVNKGEFNQLGDFISGIYRSKGIPFSISFTTTDSVVKIIHKIMITDKKAESGTIKTTNQWCIEGHFIENGQKLSGYYNAETERGHFRFTN